MHPHRQRWPLRRDQPGFAMEDAGPATKNRSRRLPHATERPVFPHRGQKDGDDRDNHHDPADGPSEKDGPVVLKTDHRRHEGILRHGTQNRPQDHWGDGELDLFKYISNDSKRHHEP
jgi:hypothetical protein